MQTSLIVLRQVLIILLLLSVGAVSFKTRLISESAANDMAGFALKVVTPCVVIRAFQIDFDPALLRNMLIAAVLAVLCHLLGILLARVFFGGQDGGSNRIYRFAVTYCNCGFMGIPLIEGAVGEEGVLYASVYIVVFQALMWSHGVMTVKGGFRSIRPFKIFINAGTIGIAVGLPLFFTSTALPPVLSETVGHIANLNTPLAMIVSGVFIAKSDLRRALTGTRQYLCVALRQLAIPLLMMGLMLLWPAPDTVALTLLLIAACPVASAVTLFAAQYGSERDLSTAAEVLTLSNILSAVTIPAIVLLYGALH